MCVTFFFSRVKPSGRHSLHGDLEGGAAKRRRTVGCACSGGTNSVRCKMALAAALNHSRDVGPVTYNALRSQKIARGRGHALRSQRKQRYTEFFSLLFPDFKKVRQLLLARGRGCPRTRAHPRPGLMTPTSNVWMQVDTGQWRMLSTQVVVDQPWS